MRHPQPLWPAVALALAAIAAVVQFSLPLNFDVSWYLYGAGRLLDGGTLYVDWVEPNPPLIVWLSLPFQVLARWTGLSAQSLLHVGGLLVVAASLALSAACLRKGRPEEDSARDAVLMVMAFALLSVVGHHFFQREHIFLATALPYACAASVRLRGLPLGRPLAIVVGAVAAVGLALKPFYLLVWLAVETLLAWRRSPRVALRAENAAIVAAGLLYGVAVLTWAPAYLEIARVGARAYRSYTSDVTTLQILIDPRALASYALVAFAIAYRRRYPVGALRMVLLAMLAGYFAAVVGQGKSFSNHWYPAEAHLLLAAFATLADVWSARSDSARWAVRRAEVAFGVALLAVAVLNAYGTVHRWRAAYGADPFYLDEMSAFLTEDGGAEEFFMIGATMRSSFPLALVTGVPYVSRFHSLWLLAGSYPGDCHDPCRPFPYHQPEEMSTGELYQFDALIADLARTRPDVLFIDLVPPQGLAGFDYEEYFSRSRAFRTELDAYRFEETVGGRYRAYRRVP